MFEFDYDQVTACKYSMSRNEVVEVLQGELTLLRRELERRDKVIDDRIKQLDEDFEGYKKIDDRRWCMAQLVEAQAFRNTNMGIHDDLRPVAEDVRRRAREAEKKGQREWTDADRLADRRMMEQTKRYSH